MPQFEVGKRVIFKPQESGGRYYLAPAMVQAILTSNDLRGIPLRRIVFDDGHIISVSVSELQLISEPGK